MSAVLAAAPTTIEDQRRLTESDPDFVRLRARTQRRLMGSVRQLVREAQASRKAAPTARSGMLNDAVNSFMQRHLRIMEDAYDQGHIAGQVDYWHGVSNIPAKQHSAVNAKTATLRKRMAFYTPSVAKMSSEVSRRAQAPRIGSRKASEANISVFLLDDAPPSLSGWLSSVGPRVQLQAQVTWPAIQDGYVDAGTADPASPYAQIWWNLEPFAQHCEDCPQYAASSPYTAPGSGGNELTNTPGDGTMACGAACKCSLEYDAPAAGPVLDAMNQAKADQWSRFLAGDPESPLQPQTVGGIQPKGTVYTPLQRGYIDEMRSAQAEWNAARGDLPENPDWLRPSEWSQVKATPWGAMTPYQQGILQKMSQINMDWLHEVGQLNWPDPPFRPDVATDMRNWLEAASRGDFTPWWKDYQEPASQHDQLQQWFEWMAQANLWPDPPPIDEKQSMEAWLEQVGKSVKWPPDFTEGENTKAREIALPTIKLYNPNHDSKGRFTYGSSAKTTVAKGKGRTIRGEGGKRVSNVAKVTYLVGGRQQLNAVFGRNVSNDDVRSMMQASRDQEIKISSYGDKVALYTAATDSSPSRARIEFYSVGSSVIGNGNIRVDSEARSTSSGRQVLTGLQAMSDNGVTRFSMIAAGPSFGEYNGYDTWAKLGATGKIPDELLGAARAAFGNVSNVEDVMGKAGGPQWWRANGNTWNATMDLRPGSRTMKIVGRLLGK